MAEKVYIWNIIWDIVLFTMRQKLSLYLWTAPRTPLERQQNKETLELAKKIRYERQQELLEKGEGYRLKKDRQIDFIEYFQAYIDGYTKKDIRMMIIALNRFKDFFKDTPEYTISKGHKAGTDGQRYDGGIY